MRWGFKAFTLKNNTLITAFCLQNGFRLTRSSSSVWHRWFKGLFHTVRSIFPSQAADSKSMCVWSVSYDLYSVYSSVCVGCLCSPRCMGYRAQCWPNVYSKIKSNTLLCEFKTVESKMCVKLFLENIKHNIRKELPLKASVPVNFKTFHSKSIQMSNSMFTCTDHYYPCTQLRE